MPSKTSPTPSSTTHPALGTLIDDGNLELVEVLGVGGYGVVYRAVDTHSPNPQSYAVKCLMHAQLQQSCRQRQIHIREIALHQIASAHPNVVTLHRVIEDYKHTYIIMDYASDGDLFSQILYSCRYLGDDYLIKHVFLQLLDAVEYCHSLGIYHRDLKPENVLCFDGGLRIAITDFGLATTDKVSEEFRTGSVYHMSPECQGGEFAPTGTYSPMFNDIWSLAIILLNLATGRNPWKSASASDPTFQAYLRDPLGFLPTVLPISLEINAILTRMLEVDWRDRMTLPELRQAIEDVDSFYSEGVVFEGSMARCPWESGMDIDSDSSTKESSQLAKSQTEDLKSHWSKDSTSDIVFASQSGARESSYGGRWTDYSSCGATWAFESPTSSDSAHVTSKRDRYDRPRTPQSTRSALSPCCSQASTSSSPATPNSVDMTFGDRTNMRPQKPLTVNTNYCRPQYYNASMASFSTGSSMMQTAIEYGPYDSSFFMASSASQSRASLRMPSSVDLGTNAATEDKEMESPSIWEYSATDVSLPSAYSTTRSSLEVHDITFNKSSTPSPDTIVWPDFRTQPIPIPQPRDQQSQPSPHMFALMTDFISPPPRPPRSRSKKSDGKLKASSIFNPIKFFPRSPPSSTISPKASLSRGQHPSEPFPSITFLQTPSSAPIQTWSGLSSPRARPTIPHVAQDRDCRRAAQIRSPRHWFSPGRLFAATGAS